MTSAASAHRYGETIHLEGYLLGVVAAQACLSAELLAVLGEGRFYRCDTPSLFHSACAAFRTVPVGRVLCAFAFVYLVVLTLRAVPNDIFVRLQFILHLFLLSQ